MLLYKTKLKLYEYQQAGDESWANLMMNFKDLCNSVEYHGGEIFFAKDIVEIKIREDFAKKSAALPEMNTGHVLQTNLKWWYSSKVQLKNPQQTSSQYKQTTII